MKADSRIIQSPKFMYPFNGDGIFIIIVATQTKAANNEDTTIFLCCCFHCIPPNPFCRSAKMSSICSVPMDRRMVLGLMPCSASSFSDN